MRSRLRSTALIAAWFDTLAPAQRELARALRDAVNGAGVALDESVKWGNLVFSLQRTHVVAIVAYRDHVDLQVFNGAALQPSHPGLGGGGKPLRRLRFVLGAAVDAAAVGALVRDSAALVEASGARGRPPGGPPGGTDPGDQNA